MLSPAETGRSTGFTRRIRARFEAARPRCSFSRKAKRRGRRDAARDGQRDRRPPDVRRGADPPGSGGRRLFARRGRERESRSPRLDGGGRAVPCRRSSRGDDRRASPRPAVWSGGPGDGAALRRGRDVDARPLLSRPRRQDVCAAPSRRPPVVPCPPAAPRRRCGSKRERPARRAWRRNSTLRRSMRRSRCSSVSRSGSSPSTGAFCVGEPWPARPSSRTSATPRSERCVSGSSSPTRTTTAHSSPPPETSSSPAANPTNTGSRVVRRSGPTPRERDLPNVGGGAPGRLDVTEDGTGAPGTSEIAPFSADGETRDVTVVVAPRGVVRGRLPSFRRVPVPPPPRASSSSSRISGASGSQWRRPSPAATDASSCGTSASPATSCARGRRPARSLAPKGSPALRRRARRRNGRSSSDRERPLLVSATPSDGALGIGLTPIIEATFSEPLGAALHGRQPREFVELNGPSGSVPVVVSLETGDTVLRVGLPSGASLAGATTYQLRVLDALPDRSGLTLGGDVVVRFTTADLTAPTVLTSAPLPGQIQVAPDVNPVVVFTKALDAATLASGVRLERRDAPQGPVLRADAACRRANRRPESGFAARDRGGVRDRRRRRRRRGGEPPPVRRPDSFPDARRPGTRPDARCAGDSDAARRDCPDVHASVRRRRRRPRPARTRHGDRLDVVWRERTRPGGAERLLLLSPAAHLVGGRNDRRPPGRRKRPVGELRAPGGGTLTLVPDAPPVLTVTSPASGTRFRTMIRGSSEASWKTTARLP